MVRPRTVVQGILDELKARQTHRIKRQMVCAAGVADCNRRHPKVLERRQPRFKDGANHLVALKVDPTNLAAAIVYVKVAGEFGVIWLERHRHRVTKMLAHISAGAVE